MRRSLLAPALAAVAVLLAGPSLADSQAAQVQSAPAAGSPSSQRLAVPFTSPGLVRTDAKPQGDELGKAVFQKWCAACHADKPYWAGTMALTYKYRGTKTAGALEKRTDLNPAFVKTMVRHGLYTMPTFRKTEISDRELDALANYLSKKKTRR